MDTLINWMSENTLLTALGAFVCGVALFYVVVRRTMKRREEMS